TASVGNDTKNRGVSWTVSCPAAPCGSIAPTASASGTSVTYTAPGNTPANDLNVTITATAAADSARSATATVTVVALSVSVAPAPATVLASGTLQLSATVGSDAANAGVTWTVACPSSPCGSVSPPSSASGDSITYTAPGSLPASNLTVTVTATSVTDKTKSSAATITLPSVAVSVSPATATVIGGASTHLTATVVGDSANKGVSWTVSCADAACGSVSPTSTANSAATTYTAPPPPAGDLAVTVTATSVANPLAAASATVTVSAITVAVDPPNPTVVATTTQQFTATVANDPNNKGVTWELSCSTNTCGSISVKRSARGTAVTYTAPPRASAQLS